MPAAAAASARLRSASSGDSATVPCSLVSPESPASSDGSPSLPSRNMTTVMLSLPPFSLAAWTSLRAASSSELRDSRMAAISSSLTIAERPSEQSR